MANLWVVGSARPTKPVRLKRTRVFARKRSRVFAEKLLAGRAVFYGDRTNDAHAVQH